MCSITAAGAKKMDPSITDVSMLGGKDPVDPLDQICKQWFTARRCNGNLEGGSCVNYPEGGFYKLNSKMECASGKNDDCEEDTCQIDMHFANSIEDYLNGNPSWAPDSSQACPIGSGDGGATHYCAGVAPFVYITSEEPTEAPPTDPPSCSDNEIDITFLVDGSSSIEDADWNKAVDFLGTLLAGLDIGEQKTRLTIAQFSFNIKYYSKFHYWPNYLANKLEELRNDQYMAGTMTNVALHSTINNMQNHGRPGVPQILILLTDGESSQGLTFPYVGAPDAYNTGSELHAQNINTFVVAVGNEISDDENTLIASDPDSKYYHRMADFDALESVELGIKSLVCGMTRKNPTPEFDAAGIEVADDWQTEEESTADLYGLVENEDED